MQRVPTPIPVASRQRFAAVVRTGAWAVIARAVSLASLFLTVPFAYQALGPVEFGAWATATTFVYMAAFLDFGLGNGTMNLVAGAFGKNRPGDATAYFVEGSKALLQIGLAFALLVTALVWFLPWHRVLGLDAGYADSARATALVVGLGMALSAPLNLAARVQLGKSQGERTYRWQSVGHLLSLGLVVLFSINRMGLAAITFAAILGPLIASTANTLILWRELRRAPGQTRYDAIAVRSRIRRDGLTFFVLQVAAALALSMDVPLIAWLQGAEAATPYALAQRLYSVIPIGLALVLAPLWPIYRQALAAGDYQWAENTLSRTLRAGTLFAVLVATVLTLGFSQILSVWVGAAPQPTTWLAAGFATWCVLESMGVSMATFLNAAGIMRIQVVTASLFALGCITLKIIALKHEGAWVLPWVTAAVYLVTTLVPTLIARRRLVQLAISKSY